jgi:hypothetical protein
MSKPTLLIPFNNENELRYFCQELLAGCLIDSFNELEFLNVNEDFEV